MTQQHPDTCANEPLPNDLLIDVADTFKALSDPTHAQLVYLLTAREYSVNDRAQFVDVTPSALSHHLAKLRDLRMVRMRRNGNQIGYSIDDTHVAALFRHPAPLVTIPCGERPTNFPSVCPMLE